jgi:fructoselysine-6-P-deglycase FrlB-like protein/sugar/nucleoside kinase (ribokinase family)
VRSRPSETAIAAPAAPVAATPSVIVVGNLTLDDVVLPDGRTRMGATGGNTLYAALGARPWRSDVGLVTRRGEDFPAEDLEHLRALGLALEGVVDIPGPTVRNWVVYEQGGERHWIYRTPPERYREVAVQPADLPDAWLTAALPPHVHVAAMPLDAAEAIVERLRGEAPACVITLDTHEDYVAGYRERLLALASRVDAFLPSREELADLVGYDEPVRALAELSRLPTPAIVAKLGADGCLVWDARAGQLSRVGASEGAVVDTTGAGDAFCGGFLAGLSDGLGPAEAARRGTVSASFAVAGFGSLALGELTAAAVSARLAKAPPPVTTNAPSTSSCPIPRPQPAGDDRRAIVVMREEIETIPDVIADQRAALEPVLNGLAHSLVAGGVEHAYLVGCGDSMFAGLGTCLAFARHAGIAAEAIHALEFARYRVRYLPAGSLVACVSYSGEVGRTIEAAAHARERGHRVVALTGRADGRLAREVDTSVLLDVPTLGFSPGTSTYVAMQTALLGLATAWGRARGRSADGAGAGLSDVPAKARATLALAAGPARALAAKLAGQRWVTFLGAGPNEASARFGAAKLMEGPQILGVATNIEEWAHEEYFVSSPGTPVVMIAPSGAASDRATEILSELRFIGAQTALVSDRRPPWPDVHWLPLEPGLGEELSPVIAALPLSLLAFFLADATGKRSYNFPTPEAEREHYETIHGDTRGTPA